MNDISGWYRSQSAYARVPDFNVRNDLKENNNMLNMGNMPIWLSSNLYVLKNQKILFKWYEIKIILSKLTVFIKIFIYFHQNCL